MLVVMQAHASEEQVRAVCQKIEKLGYRAHAMPGAQRTAIGITGNKGEVEQGTLEEMAGVQEVIKVSKPYKLVSRDLKEENTVIRFPGTAATIGGPALAVVAGPCAIESREQAFAVAERVHRAGAQFFRGGAYKPRTSPYSFQGLGEEGLRIMAEIRQQFGMKIITEAIDNESLDLVEEYADAYGLKFIVNRCGLLTGPWQMAKSDQGVMALWMAAHYFRRELSYIGFQGTGKQVRDVLHIDDFCDLLVDQIRHFTRYRGRCYNVGGGLANSLSLQETTRLCVEITGNTIRAGSCQNLQQTCVGTCGWDFENVSVVVSHEQISGNIKDSAGAALAGSTATVTAR